LPKGCQQSYARARRILSVGFSRGWLTVAQLDANNRILRTTATNPVEIFMQPPRFTNLAAATNAPENYEARRRLSNPIPQVNIQGGGATPPKLASTTSPAMLILDSETNVVQVIGKSMPTPVTAILSVNP
jgi:hypothetical protein